MELLVALEVLLVIAFIVLILVLIRFVRLTARILGRQVPGQTEDDTIGYFSEIKVYENKQLLYYLTGKFNLMALSLTDTQQASGVLTFKDKKLAVTDVPDGAVTLTSSDESVFTATYEDATNTVTVVAGNPGVAALSIKATNKAGTDIPFEDIAIEVKSGDAQTGGVDFGEPTEQP